MTGLEELTTAERRYRAAAERAEGLRRDRNAAVIAALDAGMTHAQVAAATGLTRGRVGQIAATRA